MHKTLNVNGVFLHGIWLAARDLRWWGWLILSLVIFAKAVPMPSRRRRSTRY